MTYIGTFCPGFGRLLSSDSEGKKYGRFSNIISVNTGETYFPC